MFKEKNTKKRFVFILVGVIIGLLMAIVLDYPRQQLVYRLGEINKEIELTEGKINPLQQEVLTLNFQVDSLKTITLKKDILLREAELDHTEKRKDK